MKKIILAAVVIGIIVAGAFVISQNKNDPQEPAISPTSAPSGLEGNLGRQANPKFSGKILAGTISPVVEFNPSDYGSAKTSKQLVILYFYANWCPICREEIPKFYEALSKLNNPEVIAFRVNYNDSETDGNEKALAGEFGVLYQHTKVFLKNGQRVLYSPESWDQERYLEEIKKALR